MSRFVSVSGRLLAAGAVVCLFAACQPAPSTQSVPAIADVGPEWPVLVAGPENVAGFDAAGLAGLEARMRGFVAEGAAPGIATLLVHDGKVVQYTQDGVRHARTGEPITPDTIYRLYSMSKPITGVAMMMLWEQGLFSLDDPVAKYLPEFADLQVLAAPDAAGSRGTVPLARQPTMRELMSHTAGFAYGLFGDDPANTAFRDRKLMESPDLDTFIKRVAEVPLLFQPGEYWAYSSAVDIQGAIVERLSGMPFGQFLATRVFQPLGMTDTGFYVPEDQYQRLSDVFVFDPKAQQLVPYPIPRVAYRQDTVAMESGGGGLVGTMGDYARFCQMLVNNGSLGGVRILAADTVQMMRQNVLPEGTTVGFSGNSADTKSNGMGFGLDFGVIYDAELSPSPYGQGTYFWGGAAGTWFWIDPTNNLFFIGMIQRFPWNAPPVDFRTTSADLVYGAVAG